MTLTDQIKLSFPLFPIPEVVVDERAPETPEHLEALEFQGMNWQEVSWQFWETNSDAFYAFNEGAFVYYLPSMLACSINAPHLLKTIDSLGQMLDRSPEPRYWDEFIADRMIGLSASQYECLQSWILFLADQSTEYPPFDFGRAFDTVTLLAKASANVRSLISKG
jgi:hypothetical protein